MKNTNREQNTQAIAVAAEIYARCNASDALVFCKPMKGMWYMFTCAMTSENVQALLSTVEPSDEGAKFRFRPSNSQFYRAAAAAGVSVEPLASVEYVDALVVEIAAATGCRVNRGHAIEKLVQERNGFDWTLNQIQAGFWLVPDVTLADGRKAQVKAYGGSVTERDLHAAVAACK